jgi:hypothetical protein
MNLIISHLEKGKIDHDVDNYLGECIRTHILEHFKMKSTDLKARAVFGQDGPLFHLKQLKI